MQSGEIIRDGVGVGVGVGVGPRGHPCALNSGVWCGEPPVGGVHVCPISVPWSVSSLGRDWAFPYAPCQPRAWQGVGTPLLDRGLEA